MEEQDFSIDPDGEAILIASTLAAAREKQALNAEPEKKGTIGFVVNDKVPHPWLPGTITAIAGLTVIIKLCGGPDFLYYVFGTDSNLKVQYYGFISAVLACIVGFEITASTMFLTISHETLLPKFAAAKLLHHLFNAFIHAIETAGLSLVACIIAMFLDKGNAKATIGYLLEVASIGFLALSTAYTIQSITIIRDVGNNILKRVEKKVQSSLP